MKTKPNKMIDELLDYEGDDLSAWEVEFVDSLDKQRRGNVHWEPSPKQQSILERIIQKI